MFPDDFVTTPLHTGGRYFTCPYCYHVNEHPPIFLWYYLIGYGYCPFCARWTPLSNGDGLGIVQIDKHGPRTILHTSTDAANNE